MGHRLEREECKLLITPQVDRDRVCLEEIIGEGQFGDVHKGYYRVQTATPSSGDQVHPVAVKTCKVDDDAMAEKFLEEACEFYLPTTSI